MGRINLSVKIGKLKLKNPIMAASGTFGCGEEYGKFVNLNRLGAIVTKTVTLRPRVGNPPPRLEETPSGMLNSIGLENKGLEDFLNEKMPFLKKLKTSIIISIGGEKEEEFVELAKRLDREKRVDGLELNLSCPNLMQITGGRRRATGIIAQSARATHRIVKAVRKATGLTLIAKLSPQVTDIVEIARACEDAGADAISLINTFPAMAVDANTRMPKLGNVTGGLSGPAIKPLALKMVWDVFNSTNLPLIGMGGIMTEGDAIEFILCGATAVQIGTANFVNPFATVEILDGVKGYLLKNRIRDINRLIGELKWASP